MRTYYLALLALYEAAVFANPVAGPVGALDAGILTPAVLQPTVVDLRLMKRQSSSPTASSESASSTVTGAYDAPAISLSSGTYTYPNLVPTAHVSLVSTGGQRQTTEYGSTATTIARSELGTALWTVPSTTSTASSSTSTGAAPTLGAPRVNSHFDSGAVPLLGAMVYLLVGF